MRIYSGAIIIKGQKIGLQRRDDKKTIVNPGKITAFGGVAERDEGPDEAMSREFAEEIQMDIADFEQKYIGKTTKIEADGTPTECHFYLINDGRDRIKQVYEGGIELFSNYEEAIGDVRLSETCRWAVSQAKEKYPAG